MHAGRARSPPSRAPGGMAAREPRGSSSCAASSRAPGPRRGKLRFGPATSVSAAVTGAGDCSGGLGRECPRAKEVAFCLAMPRCWRSWRIGRNFLIRMIALGVPAGTRGCGSRCSGPWWRPVRAGQPRWRMRAPIASGAGFLPATGGRFFGATSPGDAAVRATAGVLSARLRSPEHGLESQEGRRLRLRGPPVNGSRPARPGQGTVVQAAGRVKGAFQGWPVACARNRFHCFVLPSPRIPAIARNAPRLE
jgi:hypothetical protein